LVRSKNQSRARKNQSDLMSKEFYNILCKGRKIYSNLTEEEYFNTMEDLAIDFYLSGTPQPNEIETEIIGETLDGN
jgi:hypothetical protein